MLITDENEKKLNIMAFGISQLERMSIAELKKILLKLKPHEKDSIKIIKGIISHKKGRINLFE